MRIFLLCILILIALGFHPAVQAHVIKIPSVSMSFLRDITFTKEIQVYGTNQVGEEVVRKLLPLDESVFWWITNSDEVVEDLKKNIYVADASATSCADWIVDRWGCFNIQVKERDPTYLVYLEKNPWVVGADGVFMFPLHSQRNISDLDAHSDRHARLKEINGISKENVSPDVVKARFNYTVKALKTIERVTGLELSGADLSRNGELLVSFYESNIKARFEFSKDDWKLLEEEALRLKILLRELENSKEQVEEIDLAYKQLAVVKLKEVAEKSVELKN